ncbi:MAG: TonB-dependent receptor [Chlorobi bacterium]|nr:TonB-dependent receptor [Chlorobiota bacterium]
MFRSQTPLMQELVRSMTALSKLAIPGLPPIMFWMMLAVAPVAAQTAWTVEGRVTDGESGEPVVGATVRLLSDSTAAGKVLRGGVSNREGMYALRDMPAGQYFLNVRSVGFGAWSAPVEIGEKREVHLNVRLHRKDIMGDGVTVEARRQMAMGKVSVVELPSEFVARMPSLGGEADIFRALQLMPGVKSIGEISSGLYVRGGSPDENLTLLDGTVIYNPSHVGGFLSSFNNDAVRDVKLVKGSFPAEYGGRLSSVLDVTMRDGTAGHISGTAGISLLSSRLALYGPLSDNATFMVSGRRMYLDLIAPFVPAADTIPRYYFYDLNGRIGWKPSINDQVSVSGYIGRDRLTSSPEEPVPFTMVWGNSLANARWSHVFSPVISIAGQLGFSGYEVENLFHYRDSLDIVRSSFRSASAIHDITFRADLTAHPDSTQEVKAGFELISHATLSESGYEYPDSDSTLHPHTADAVEFGLYLQNKLNLTDALTMDYGGRLSWFSGGAYLQAEPRLSLKYAPGVDISLLAAFSLSHQYMHLVARNDLPLPSDTWFMSTGIDQPEQAMQGSLGIEWNLMDNMFLLSAEGYYKQMDNLYDYRESADFSADILLDSNLVRGGGSAYGVELFLNKKIGPVTGWIGYTLSWTTRAFAYLNQGRPFYPRYDSRHDVSVVAACKLNDRWELSATWTYVTGQPYTFAGGQYQFPGLRDEYHPHVSIISRFDYPGRNSHRLPAFHKLDLNATYSFRLFDIPWQFSMNIYNAYNHRNIFSQYAEQSIDFDPITGAPTQRLELHQVSLFPILPTVGLSCTF